MTDEHSRQHLTNEHKRSSGSPHLCRKATALALLVAVLGLGCGGNAANDDPGTSRAAAKLEVVGGAAQVSAAGEELPAAVVVRVLDAAAAPVAGQVVNFVVTAGGGSVFAGTAVSNAAGEARERWTLGPVLGLQRLEARAVDAATGAPLVFATFEATAVVGRPAQVLVATEELTPVLGAITSAKAQVVDSSGRGIAGVPVTFAVTAGGGYFSVPEGQTDQQAATTDGSGFATPPSFWYLGPSGPQQMEARVTGLAPAVFALTPPPPGPRVVSVRCTLTGTFDGFPPAPCAAEQDTTTGKWTISAAANVTRYELTLDQQAAASSVENVTGPTGGCLPAAGWAATRDGSQVFNYRLCYGVPASGGSTGPGMITFLPDVSGIGPSWTPPTALVPGAVYGLTGTVRGLDGGITELTVEVRVAP